jgi:hypothetical protein
MIPKPKAASRVDEHGRAYRGSQMQTQLYVNRRAHELNAAIFAALPDLADQQPTIVWRSPLESGKFAEYRDGAFLKAVGLGQHTASLAQFWPSRGPVWDALAQVDLAGGGHGVILLEAKAHCNEMYAGGTRAGVQSRKQITAAIQATQKWSGSTAPVAQWLDSMAGKPNSSLYQLANRIAMLYWLREVANVPAWLVNLYVLGDSYRNTTQEMWDSEIEAAYEQLGLASKPLHTCSVFLPGRERSELVAGYEP